MRLITLKGFDPPAEGDFHGYKLTLSGDVDDIAVSERLIAALCPPCIVNHKEGINLWVPLGGEAEALFELLAAHFVEGNMSINLMKFLKSDRVRWESAPLSPDGSDVTLDDAEVTLLMRDVAR